MAQYTPSHVQSIAVANSNKVDALEAKVTNLEGVVKPSEILLQDASGLATWRISARAGTGADVGKSVLYFEYSLDDGIAWTSVLDFQAI